MAQYKLFINGDDVDSVTGQTFDHKNPANLSETVETIAWGNKEDTVKAITAARSAFDSGSWSKKPVQERIAIITKAVDALMQDKLRIATLLMKETGKALPICLMEIGCMEPIFQYNCAQALTFTGECNTTFANDNTALIIYEPVGVVGCIIPWNFPLMILAQKVAPALASGCASVIKPSEFCAGSTIEVVKIFHKHGVPAGILNVVTGPGNVVGQEIAESTLVDKVSFTGSVPTGKSVMKAASNNLKKVTLECGGKGPYIVFPDANIDALVQNPTFLFGTALLHSGQVCATGSRLMVHESIKDKFLEKYIPAVKNFAVAPPEEAVVKFPFATGPIQFQAQLDKILKYIDIGKSEGAKVLTGGHRLTEQGLDKGLFVAPTVFDNVTSKMRIAQEEIFGPVVSVLSFKSVEEAIEIANDVAYGLQATLWTNDMNTIMACSRGIKCGVVSVNTFGAPLPVVPFGGYKESGLGRENGKEGYMAYLESKTVVLAHN